jgi:ankyrin repeat protein
VVVALLDAGADVDDKNDEEENPVHVAAREGHHKLVLCKLPLR